MAFENKKRTRTSTDKAKAPRASAAGNADAGPSKPTTAPRPAPAFVSSLQRDEGDFPRGGGTTLTAFEVKQVRDEGRREADAEAALERPSKKPKRGMSDRELKRAQKNKTKPAQEHDKDQIRVEHLNYKRLVPGSRVLARVHTVLPLHLILSLPNNLLAHVPITEVSTTFTKLLSAEEDAMSDIEDESPGAPELAQLFIPGQYYPAQVLNVYPTASQNFVSQYPVTETTRLAARLEMTLVPKKVNSEVAKADVGKGFVLVGEVIEREDKGWRVGLGLGEDAKGVEGWLATAEYDLVPGQLIRAVVTGTTAGGRIVQLSLDNDAVLKAQLNEVTNVASVLPGQQVSALITAIMPNGLNVKLCGFFDGTIDLAHLALGGEDIEEKFKVGKKVKARVLYDNPSVTPRRFGLSILPHVLGFASPVAADGKTPLEAAIPIGKVVKAVTVQRVMQEWGLLVRTSDGLDGFVHISHISDDRIPSLSSTVGPYQAGTLHRARVIGHSPLDGVLLLSLEQKVLDQVFMSVDELSVGQVLQGTIHRLTDKALFVNISGSVDGAVWPLHYADINLRHPEKRFKVGSTVKARVFELDPAKSRVVLTLKKTLVESTLDIPATIDNVKQGQVVPAVVSKLLEKGAIVDLFGGMRAFIPQSEASSSFTENIATVFHIGKPINVRIIENNGKLVASARQALPTALAAESLAVGDEVKGQISQVHTEQVVVTLAPSQATALLSLSTLANHRHIGVDELRSSIKIGESLDDLVIVSKNPTSGLFIISTKKTPRTGISRQAVSFDTVAEGQIVKGKVVAHLKQTALVALSPNVKGKLHPCDVSDDFSAVKFADGGVLSVDEWVEAYVVMSNPHTRSIELSTRASRMGSGAIVDPEITQTSDLKVGETYRGFIKNIAGHGLFVDLGRNVTARVMIKELFDDYVKDWQSHFKAGQLVSGKIVQVNANQVEMSLRKNPTSKGKEAKLGLADFVEGQKVVGVVKKVEVYGMFLRIEGSDVAGLCHKSEIADSKKADVGKALQGFRPGDQVKAKILSIDREKSKVAFGIKASYFAEEAEEEERDEDGDEDEDKEDEDEDDEEDEDEEDEDEEDSDDDVLKLAAESEDEEEVDNEDEDDEEDEEDDDEEAVDGETEDEDEDVAIELDQSAPAPIKKAKTAAPAAALDLAGGFDWSASAAPDAASDSDSDADDSEAATGATAATSKTKSKSKGKDRDLTAGANVGQPESATDFERALLSSPNSSFLWIQYMSFLLQLHEIDQARKIGRQALERIGYREEEEKLNVWMALVNLELGFGTVDEADKVFKEAQAYNDARTVLGRYAEALQQADKMERAQEVLGRLVKRFGVFPDSWTRFAEFYLKNEDKAAARGLLSRATKSLPASQHLEVIQRMAILENKYGDVERCKTLFEGLVDRYPKRIDVWAVYVDQMAKAHDIQAVRSLVDRALARKLTPKKAKFLFKKWLVLEQRIGDAAGQEKAKGRAREWVAENAAARAAATEAEEEEDDDDDE